MPSDEAVVLRGAARSGGGPSLPATLVLEAEGFDLTVGDAPPLRAAYRDLAALVVDAGVVRMTLGAGAGAEHWELERFATMTGRVAAGLRDGRLRQRLADALVEVDAGAEILLVEYEAGAERGIAQLVYHDRGVVLAPVDERHPWRRIRRSEIGPVTALPEVGGLAVEGAGRSLPPAPDGGPALRLLRLGATATEHVRRWSVLRDGAAADAAAIVGGLIPDAPFAARRTAATLLLEGRPAAPDDLGEAWEPLETAVLGTPPFDEAYRVLREIGGGRSAPRWLVTAPERPGETEAPRAWFFVGLPGNLVAMELVSEGAHATYCFRVVPRSAWTGETDAEALEAAVVEVSEALLDARFLREPIALPEARLREPAARRYRLALAALPSLAAARERFVARLIHTDAEGWRGAAEALVAWHAAQRGDEAVWPGRSAQETAAVEAGFDEPPSE